VKKGMNILHRGQVHLWGQIMLLTKTGLWDRCFDFLNIFAEVFGEKTAFFAQTTAIFCKKIDHNIGFWGKLQFFRQKLAKIEENFDHYIDPWSPRLPWTRFHEMKTPKLARVAFP
jgi:hypothetical protein